MTLDRSGIKEKLVLSSGQDFQLTVDTPDGTTLPNGTTAEIIVREGTDPDSTILDTWAGVVHTAAVTWWVQSEKTDPIPNRAYYQMLIHIPQGNEDVDRCWFRGNIKRED